MKMHPHDRLKQIVSKDADAKEAVSYYEVDRAVPRLHACESATEDRPHAPDPRPPRARRLPGVCPTNSTAAAVSFRLSEVASEADSTRTRLLLERQALHAFRLRFKHPRTGNWLEVEAPLPPDMRRTLDVLREHRGR